MMYQIIQNSTCNVIVLEKDGIRLSFIEDPENSDYQRFLEWCAEGNTPEKWQQDA